MKDQIKQQAETILRTTKPKITAGDSGFEYGLRRALLNSNYFSDQPWTRWQKRLNFRQKTIILTFSSASVLIGTILFANIFYENSNTSNNQEIAVVNGSVPANTAFPDNPTLEQLNHWYQDGKIKYDHQENNGARVYLINLIGDGYIELRDPNPYTINLTSSP